MYRATRGLAVVVATLSCAIRAASATPAPLATAPPAAPTTTTAAATATAAATTMSEPAADAATATAAAITGAPVEARHSVYLEAFGKGGAWGLGYAFALDRRFAVGAVGSITALDGQRITSLAPYLSVYPLGTRHHRWFVEAGPQVVRLSTPSPVPEWSGAVSTGIGGQVSTGYEYRRGVLLRGFAMVGAGKGGVAPWFGVDVGWTL